MSTFTPGPIVLVALLAATFVSPRARMHLQPAMQPVASRRGPRCATERIILSTHLLSMATTSAPDRVRQIVHEALGMRPPQPAEYGKAARIGALRRIRSVILLLALLVALGVATALSVGVIAFLAGFLLEQAIK